MNNDQSWQKFLLFTKYAINKSENKDARPDKQILAKKLLELEKKLLLLEKSTKKFYKREKR